MLSVLPIKKFVEKYRRMLDTPNPDEAIASLGDVIGGDDAE